MINRSSCIAILLIFTLCACKQQTQPVLQEQKNVKKGEYPMPTPPSMVSDPEEKATYVAMNYWNNYNFNDTSQINDTEYTETALANYIQLLYYTPQKTVEKSLRASLKKAEVNEQMFEFFTGLYEKYLQDPNSPMRNEDFYIPILEYIIAKPDLDEVYKIRPRYQLKMALKNRTGDVASDFSYTTASGKTGRMHKLKSDYLILFFYNPECSSCKKITQHILDSPVINMLIENKTVTLLAFYPDEDISAWKSHQSIIPSTWINSYDNGKLKKEELYDLKAIPTIYLLDKEKRVLLKDAPIEVVEQRLYQLELL